MRSRLHCSGWSAGVCCGSRKLFRTMDRRGISVALWAIAAMFLLISGWSLVRSSPWNPADSKRTATRQIHIEPVAATSPPHAPVSPAGAVRRSFPPVRVQASLTVREPAVRPTWPARPRKVPSEAPARFYRIQFGPTQDLRQVEAFMERLGRSYGIVGRILTRSVPSGYRVLSGPAPSAMAAQQRANLLSALGIPSRVISAEGRYRLLFGRFPTEEEAEALSRRVRRYGFTAVVEPDHATVYLVVVRRVPQGTAVEIAQRLREEGFALSLRAERQ